MSEDVSTEHTGESSPAPQLDLGKINAVKQDLEGTIASSSAFNVLIVDVAKHMTTVATGVLVLIAAFYEKFAAAAHLRLAIPVAVVALLTSIVFTLRICMLALRQASRLALLRRRLIGISTKILGVEVPLEAVDTIPNDAGKDDKALSVCFSIANWAFFVGVCAVGSFIVANTH